MFATESAASLLVESWRLGLVRSVSGSPLDLVTLDHRSFLCFNQQPPQPILAVELDHVKFVPVHLQPSCSVQPLTPSLKYILREQSANWILVAASN